MKKVFSLLAACIMLCTVQTTKAQFAGGDGSQSSPYQITNRTQLEALKGFVGNAGKGKYFVLTEDIDLSGDYWTPIATLHQVSLSSVNIPDTAFYGKLDGQNHKILHLHTRTNVHDGTQAAANVHFFLNGLFGQLYSGASISNLHIVGDVNDTIHTLNNANYPRTSALAALITVPSDAAEGVTITNCTNNINVFDARVTSNMGHAAGGLIGHIANSSQSQDVIVSQCSNTGEVAGGFYKGGLIGIAAGYVEVHDCYYHGNVSYMSPTGDKLNGGSYAGGLIGLFGEGIIDHCYAAGTVDNFKLDERNAILGASGILGRAGTGAGTAKTAPVEITNTVALQTELKFSDSATNGRCSFRIQGYYSSDATLTNNYALSSMVLTDSINVVSVSGTTADSKDGADVALATAQTKAFYEGLGWDFASVWKIKEGESFPSLQAAGTTGISAPKTTASALKAFASKGVLTVRGAKPGEKINVYTVLGQKIHSGTATTISLPAGGIYVVTSGAQAIKIINK
ncbi:MAG: hypothetical protein LBB85_12075 [Dysgonamonadaceae bacterium]|jgi:hypothetical protein|nr:hypothetical protein [Dysgonamonadaceae bacterium]